MESFEAFYYAKVELSGKGIETTYVQFNFL